MAAGLFFNGRLYITPTTMSAVNDDAMLPQALSVGNVCAYIGLSTGGEPNTPLVFGSPQQAEATLIGGELLQAVLKAFNPSNETGGAASVIAVRVNPAQQSSLTLVDVNNNPCISLLAADYGQHTNQVNVTISPASLNGVHVTTQYAGAVYSADNIYAAPFTVQYTGSQTTATISITDTTITLAAPAATPVATINLASFPTVQQLVDYINSQVGFTASVTGGYGNWPTLNGMDAVNAVSIKAAYSPTAILQAVVNWFNSPAQSLVVASRTPTGSLPPATIPQTYLAGGSDGVTTNTNWSNAFTTLQAVSCNWVTPVTSNQAIIAMCDAHVQYMSTVGRKERRAIAGLALGTTDAAAITAALALNSDRTSLVHIGCYDYDLTGQLVGLQLYSPYMTAAIIAGAFSGLSPGTPMTNKSLKISGVERPLLNPTETDPLIQGGVLCVEATDSGFKVVRSISTWLNDNRADKVEQSTGWALDFVAQNVRNALDPLRGSKNTPYTMSRAVSITESQLTLLAKAEPNGPGAIVSWSNVTAASVDDVLAVSFQCSPVEGVDFIPITIYSIPFSGTVTAS